MWLNDISAVNVKWCDKFYFWPWGWFELQCSNIIITLCEGFNFTRDELWHYIQCSHEWFCEQYWQVTLYICRVVPQIHQEIIWHFPLWDVALLMSLPWILVIIATMDEGCDWNFNLLSSIIYKAESYLSFMYMFSTHTSVTFLSDCQTEATCFAVGLITFVTSRTLDQLMFSDFM